MDYLIIQPSAEKTSAERAECINRMLFDIVSHPTSRGQMLLLPTITHPTNDLTALVVRELDLPMPLQWAEPLDALVAELEQNLDSTELNEKATWVANMIGHTVPFSYLIPASAGMKSQVQMEELGWFETQE